MEFKFRSWSNCCYNLKFGVFNCDCSEVQFVLNYVSVHSTIYLLTYLFVYVRLKTLTKQKDKLHCPHHKTWPNGPCSHPLHIFLKFSYYPTWPFVSPDELIPWTWCPICVNVPILKLIIKANAHVSFSTAYMFPYWMWSCLHHQRALYIT